ncbi:hypothetical protein [Microvirga rosea]|uniref:hypothetical protein n=1 Tax=Microvirga rosea TaxID=2715425 RepID=UPI001D0B7E28|nr:hypothetical protein [Microvirga rosea]MCB8819964.1 hypothetical protein [Microvirga rosea]
MNLIRLPSHAVYRTDTIIRLLADSPIPALSEERYFEYLWMCHGIGRDQIKGSFLNIRIAANNLRASRYRRSKFLPVFHVSTVPGANVHPSRVPVAGHSGPAIDARS